MNETFRAFDLSIDFITEALRLNNRFTPNE